MQLSKFSTRCVYIPPFKTDYTLSQSQKEEIKQMLETTFTELRDAGITTLLCIGGMGLDYERYDVSHIIPSVLVYHSRIEYMEVIEELYNVTQQDVADELKMFDNRLTFLEDLIYHDAKCEALADAHANGWYVTENDIEFDVPLIYKYHGDALLYQWLQTQKVLTCFNVNKHTLKFKNAFTKNKSGLKIDIHSDNSKYYICGNLTRKDLIFK